MINFLCLLFSRPMMGVLASAKPGQLWFQLKSKKLIYI